MDIDALAKWLGGEWAVIVHAPLSFLASVLVVGFAIWKALKWQFESRLDNAKDALALRDTQLQNYKDKLSGASPDEAKAQRDALEARVNELESKIVAIGPKKITPEQRQSMASILSGLAGSEVVISIEMSSQEATSISKWLVIAFESAGWKIRNYAFFGTVGAPPPSPTGISLQVASSSSLTAEQLCIVKALRTAGLDFEIQQIANLPEGARPPTEIRLTHSFQD